MDIKLSLDVKNLDSVRASLEKLSGKEAKEAYAKAVNDTAFQAQREMRKALRSSFDRVTPYIERSPVVEKATAAKLSASVGPRTKSGIDPQKILQAQEFGGQRQDKRLEAALRAMGILPQGMQTATPADRYGGPYPGTDDGRGNFNGNFVRKLIAYLKTSASQVAGMKRGDQTRALKKYTFQTNMKTRREIKLMDGKEWFVSTGAGAKSLGPGIWVRDGRTIRLAVAFVSRPTYRAKRLSMERIANDANLQNYLDRRVRFRVREAAGE